ncbi:MAG: AsmA family protein [Desulforhopalus sp.]
MRRFIKYGVAPAVAFLFLAVITIIVLPTIINVQRYVPEIEKKLSNVTGRPISFGPGFGLSFFPWLNISISNLKIGNPDGYASESFIEIESFEARVRLLPLLTGQVEVSRFIIGGLDVTLERRGDGQQNWDSIGANYSGKNKTPYLTPRTTWSFPEGLSVALFVVTDGRITWVDTVEHSTERIDDLMLVLNNIKINDQVMVDFKATIDGKTLAAEGKMGPLGKNPGQEVLPVDLAFSFANSLSGQVQGTLGNLSENPEYALDLQVPSFSVRELCDALKVDFPFVTADADTFRSVSIDLIATGDSNELAIQKGRLKVDDSSIDVSLLLKDFDHPDLGFVTTIDSLDLDRYLLFEWKNNSQKKRLAADCKASEGCDSWWKLDMAGAIQFKDLKVGGGTLTDVNVHLRAADGVFDADPLSFSLYSGQAQSSLRVDLQSDIVQTNIVFKAEGIRAGPLLRDFAAADLLSGSTDMDITLSFSGKSIDDITKSLHADGILIVRDGILKGVDLINTKRNIETYADDPASAELQIATDFSNLKSIFSIRNGLVESHDTRLNSSSADVVIAGTADLVNEQLGLMVDQKVVAVMSNDQEPKEKSSVASVPFTLSGTFTKPLIGIDAQYLSSVELELPEELDMQSLVEEKLPTPAEEGVRDLVGKPLTDPAIVAERIGLQPEFIGKGERKRQFTLGSGRVRVGPLQEKDDWR